jgi:hypothetical protein
MQYLRYERQKNEDLRNNLLNAFKQLAFQRQAWFDCN